MWVSEGFAMEELDGENTGLFEIREHQSGNRITLSREQLRALAQIITGWDFPRCEGCGCPRTATHERFCPL